VSVKLGGVSRLRLAALSLRFGLVDSAVLTPPALIATQPWRCSLPSLPSGAKDKAKPPIGTAHAVRLQSGRRLAATETRTCRRDPSGKALVPVHCGSESQC
jgi:hypothetical protein